MDLDKKGWSMNNLLNEIKLIQFNTGKVDFLFGGYNKETARLFPYYQIGWDSQALSDRKSSSNTTTFFSKRSLNDETEI